ncbi:ATP-dependent helicase [Gleimia sp. 6138-11-ORH1]|uniref:ATP-dependent DNA helicase n=1 Tax=Gleimia sp. 6138-11-ORH1 TaxID=2973937 RepID=UPI002168C398|nr:ATP-dependent DNA helicase [Gleimia sp. 6138-11-ORH1]MCS4483980.1 ATP-dependent helicase [Gleimia sp. 6138-11-ORH1]
MSPEKTPAITAKLLAESSEPRGTKINYPTAEQTQVIEGKPVPTLVIAGAGSGKTETMSQRVLYLITKYGIKPERILGLTFTRKAAGEFSSRLRKRIGFLGQSGLLAEAANDPWFAASVNVSTYDSFAGNIVKEYGVLLGLDPNIRLITAAASWQLIDNILITYQKKLPKNQVEEIRKATLALANELTSHGVTTKELQEFIQETTTYLLNVPLAPRKRTLPKTVISAAEKLAEMELLLPVIEKFNQYKEAEQLLDFADQMALALKLVREYPHVVDSIRAEYDAVLLDEFQDTSVAQMELLSRLFKDLSVTAVGDPNQAIYGWRGASAASLDLFLPMFAEKTTGETLFLSTAWRNQPKILEAANLIAAPLAEKTYPGVDVLTLQPAPQQKPRSGEVTYLYPHTNLEEYDFVAQQVKNWKLTYTDQKTGKNLETYAILVRTRAHFLPLIEALERYGLEAAVVGLGGLVTQPAVTDLRAILTACVNPLDGPAVMRLITNLDLPARDLKLLYAWARHRAKERSQDSSDRSEFLLDAVDIPPQVGWSNDTGEGFSQRSHQQINLLRMRLETIRATLDQQIPYVIAKAIRVFDLDIEVAADPYVNLANNALDAFLEVANDYASQTEYARLDGFLDWINTTIEAEQGLKAPAVEVDPSVIQIMTVHQAKGLEWDRVAVVGLTEGSFPSYTGAHYIRTDGKASLGPEFTFENRPQKEWVGNYSQLPHPLRLDYKFPTGEPILPAFIELNGDDSESLEEELEAYFMRLASYQEKEERRLAYVAFTRPKKELLLSGAWYTWGKKSIQKPSRYLREIINSGIAKPAEETPLVEAIEILKTQMQNLPDALGEEKLPTIGLENEKIVWDEPCLEIDDFNFINQEVQFPRRPGNSRTLVNESAKRVNQLILTQSENPVETAPELEYDQANQAQSELVHSVQRAFAQYQRQLANQVIEVTVNKLSATSAATLLLDPKAYALQLRRPLPQAPSQAALMGTIFHKWAQTWCQKAAEEPMLFEPTQAESAQTSNETEISILLESLTEKQRKQLEVFQKRAKEIFTPELPTVVGLEVPFSFQQKDVTIRGQIDVLTQTEGKWKVIDWKTGHPVTPEKSRQNIAQLSGYLGQLMLYRKAIAQQKQVPESEVKAELIFLGGSDTYSAKQRRVSLEMLQEILPEVDIETLLAGLSQNQ